MPTAAGPYPHRRCRAAPPSPSTPSSSSSGRAPGSRSRSGSRTLPRCSAPACGSRSRACCCSGTRRCGGGRSETDRLLALILGLLPFAFCYGLVYWGEQYIPSGLTAVLFGVMPLYTAILAAALLHDEPLRARVLPASTLALAGLSLAFAESLELGSEERAALGAAAVVLSPLGAALGNIALKRRAGELDAIVLNGWGMLVGGGLLLALSAASEDWGDAVWGAKAVGSILYLAVVGSAVAFVTLTILLREMSAQASSFIALMIPFGALVFGACSTARRSRPAPSSGAALVVAGLLRARRRPRRRSGAQPGAGRRVSALGDQLDYLEASSPFYRERIRGRRALTELPFTTKERAAREPAAAAAVRRAPVRRPRRTSSASTSPPARPASRSRSGSPGTTTRRTRAVGGEAFAIAGLRPTDTVAHCLNYALYAGGIADHMAIEASGATVVPVGVGQSQRLLDLIPRLGITAIFGTLSFPAYLATRAREQGLDPTALGLRHIVTAGEPGAGLAAVRAEIERAWDVSVTDTFGMSDVWSTMAGECGQGDGPAPDHRRARAARGHRPRDRRAAAARGRRRRASSCGPTSTAAPRRCCAIARATSPPSGPPPAPAAAPRPRIRIGGRRDDMLRVQAVNVYPQAIGELLDGARHAIVADGDPIVPPLHVYVGGDRRRATGSAPRCAPTSPCTRSPPGDAPRRRAQDREGVPHGARRRAARRDPTTQGGTA